MPIAGDPSDLPRNGCAAFRATSTAIPAPRTCATNTATTSPYSTAAPRRKVVPMTPATSSTSATRSYRAYPPRTAK